MKIFEISNHLTDVTEYALYAYEHAQQSDEELQHDILSSELVKNILISNTSFLSYESNEQFFKDNRIYKIDQYLVKALERVYDGFLGIKFELLINAFKDNGIDNDNLYILLPNLEELSLINKRRTISYYMFKGSHKNSDKALNWFEESRILSNQLDYQF